MPLTLKYRTLGNTELSVSEIGFGCWGIGGDHKGAVAYGKTDDVQSLRALQAAVDEGINFFDTSDFYGYGHSEELLGRAFETPALQEQTVIASKGGMLDPDGNQDFSKHHIQTVLEGSLRRLKRERIDLYQLHSPAAADLGGAQLQETIGFLEDARSGGKIGVLGFSARSPQEAVAALELYPFAAVQVNFNLTDQRARDCNLFEVCAERGAGIIVRTPLCFGFLTGDYNENTGFPEGDHRNRWPEAQKKLWFGALKTYESIYDDYSEFMNRTQFALQYCLSYAGVATTIPGMLTEEHVRDNAAASDVRRKLGKADLGKIEATYASTNFVSGR